MAKLRWITPEGNLGTYAENTEVSLQLDVENPVAPAPSAGFDPRDSITGNGIENAVQTSILTDKTAWRIQTNNLTGLVKVGAFPNNENPNRIAAQSIDLFTPYRGGLNRAALVQTPIGTGVIGVSAVGIVLFAPASETTITSFGLSWTVNAVAAGVLGEDASGGQPTTNGTYNYRTSRFINANAWQNLLTWKSGYRHTDGHSKILGWAIDGYPIYGPYGYDNPSTIGGVVRMRSGYTLVEKSGRPLPASVNILPGRHPGTQIPVRTTQDLQDCACALRCNTSKHRNKL